MRYFIKSLLRDIVLETSQRAVRMSSRALWLSFGVQSCFCVLSEIRDLFGDIFSSYRCSPGSVGQGSLRRANEGHRGTPPFMGQCRRRSSEKVTKTLDYGLLRGVDGGEDGSCERLHGIPSYVTFTLAQLPLFYKRLVARCNKTFTTPVMYRKTVVT